jgi:hypothetical protein
VQTEFRYAIIHNVGTSESNSISSAIEDYAKAIYSLQMRGGDSGPVPVTTNALAERLGVTPASSSTSRITASRSPRRAAGWRSR